MVLAIFHPEIWFQFGHYDYRNQILPSERISVNNPQSLKNSDFLIIHQNIDNKIKVLGNIKASIFIPGEEKASFPEYPQKYLDQFDFVVTNRQDLTHHSLINSHYFHPWQVKKTKLELNNISFIRKTRKLSAVISSSTLYNGHKKRYAFINRMIGHFKERLDWFSKDENPINDKWDGLAPYEYSFAIENSCFPGYFTEKISDCFLSLTMPIYFGAPDINTYFDDRSYIGIDLNNWEAATEKVESAIYNDLYTKNFKYVQESRKLVLEKYNLISGVKNVIDNLPLQKYTKGDYIYPLSRYDNKHLIRMIKRKLNFI